MSRIGKKPILIPEGVKAIIQGQEVIINGPKGELSQVIDPVLKVEIKEKEILITPNKNTKKSRALWGLSRTLIANNIQGVVKGYEKRLEIQGIGYKAVLDGETLVLSVGFSHPVKIEKPEGIDLKVERNIIIVSGINKMQVGQVAAEIRKIKPSEPYKGKGIKYVGEKVRRKQGKKVVTAEK